jgi:hypothetical protein
MAQDPGISGGFIFVGKAVDDVVSLSAYNMYALFVTNICIVFLLHRYRCFESGRQLIFEIILFQDISQAYCGNILEKLPFTFLIR